MQICKQNENETLIFNAGINFWNSFELKEIAFLWKFFDFVQKIAFQQFWLYHSDGGGGEMIYSET